MKIYFLPFLLFSTLVFSQQTSLGLQSIQASNQDDYLEAEMLFQKLKEITVGTNRFVVLDRETLGIALSEQEIQKQITSINAQIIAAQGKIEGAGDIMGGKLIKVQYKDGGLLNKVGGLGGKKKNTVNDVASKLYFRAIFSFSLYVISTETSETLHSKTFNVGILDKNPGGASKQEAFQAALKTLESKIKKEFINEYFPEEIAILRVEKEVKGEAETILINTGKSSGTKKNDRFEIFQISVENLGGEELRREKKIAEVKVTAVEGKALSLAKVSSGGGELLKSINDGEKLICKLK
ncbi:CsgG/HfaB family protein [Flavivirga amylovorans]|uniref:CsgG/HfaB family protein n=1 Tax=Flavivirga amylovorans TaxID=870486 RepID=A0ABT8WXL8_9FLAO|nr:CsgG/HfaB family protein [Flavivirga amylovorans]MDO5986242.1 CsgG/HfaB family protein [Flavivirga amylovorans]